MHFAAQGNQPKVLNHLLKIENFEIECPDVNGNTPLHWACVSGSYQAVRYLLAYKADPNKLNLNDKCTPLHLSIKYMDEAREIRTVHKLLIYGARVDVLVRQP